MKINNTVKLIGVGIVAILAVAFLMRSCTLYDKVSELKGEHEALQIAYADLDMKSREMIAAYQQDIAAKDKAIAEANHTVGIIKDKLKTKDAAIADLEAEYVNLGENKDAKISNLQAQIAVWKDKFTLAEGIIAEKDAIIFDLTAKYETQVKITLEWKASYDRQTELHSVCLERITAMEKEWRGVKFASRVKTYVIAAVGAALVYSLVKK